MKTSELIRELSRSLEENGDLTVVTNSEKFTTSDVYLQTREYYYDGGVLIKDSKDNSKWVKSRNHPELGSNYLEIKAGEPLLGEYGEYIEGFEIPAMADYDDDEVQSRLLDMVYRL